ncbi:GIY-YIG nuclease family protein [Chitinophaga arvensicola]|uniref:T5orf172 domain-containing protein n=1 Tax=Chitinophaga arvensicola TaxID=29529 RepID=A0A1I0RHQ2_9BACT|nr:GIY-YIG nuclease family protein [Chitinophaga arvensicola]SEW40379.1 T5orf172 domain-containing protein [Chitinophaga arvensicola]
MSQYSFGFVYVFTNKIMPHLVKIGMTTALAEDRAKDLFSTSSPDPFEVVFSAITSNPTALEKLTHDLLKDKRYRPNREFFEVSPEVAIDTILQARQETDGIKAWAKQSQVFLQNGDRLLLSMRANQVLFLSGYPSIIAPEAEMIDLWQAHTDGDTLELYFTDDPGYTADIHDDAPFSHEDPVPYLNRTKTADNDTIIYKARMVPGDRLLWMDDSAPRFVSALFESKCHCQLIARTRDPKFTEEGIPKLINLDPNWKASTQILEASRYVCSLPRPRVWAPRNPDTDAGWAGVAWKNAPPEYWLPQLNQRAKPRKQQ